MFKIIKIRLKIWLIIFAFSAISISTKCISAQDIGEALKNPEIFSYWFGAYIFQSELCQIALPEKLIDHMANQAHVTKEMITGELNKSFLEGYNDSKKSAEREGLSIVCNRVKAHLYDLNQRGITLQ